MPAVPALGNRRQEDQEFMASIATRELEASYQIACLKMIMGL